MCGHLKPLSDDCGGQGDGGLEERWYKVGEEEEEEEKKKKEEAGAHDRGHV